MRSNVEGYPTSSHRQLVFEISIVECHTSREFSIGVEGGFILNTTDTDDRMVKRELSLNCLPG